MDRTSSPRSPGFTLVELLMVISIMAIIMAFVAPAVSGFGRSAGLTSGGNTVVNLASLARQTAMSKGTLTALVVLADQGTEDDFRALTVLEYSPDIGWIQSTAWELLPTGVIVDRSDLEESSFLLNSPRPFPFVPIQENPPTRYQGKQVENLRGYAARIFLPNGSLQNPEQPAQLRLVEGYLTGSRVSYTRPGQGRAGGSGAGPANYYDVTLLGATGIAKVTRP